MLKRDTASQLNKKNVLTQKKKQRNKIVFLNEMWLKSWNKNFCSSFVSNIMSLGEYNTFGDTFGLSNLLSNYDRCFDLNNNNNIINQTIYDLEEVIFKILNWSTTPTHLKTKTVWPINLPSHHHQHHLFQAQTDFCAFFAGTITKKRAFTQVMFWNMAMVEHHART